MERQYVGDCSVTDDSGTVRLTKLRGSCITRYKHSIWTCKPVVQLPVHVSLFYPTSSTKTRAKALGVSLMPSIEDVVQNLTNLANTEFADFSRFHQCGTKESAKISHDLPDVVVSMLKCINENIKKVKTEDHSAVVTKLRDQLEELNFLPVKLNINGYALVKPAQVLAMDSITLRPYYPFLHPLEEKLQPTLQLLSQIGVTMSLDFSHIQLFFKLAKNLFKEGTVDINVKLAVIKATEQLIVLLRKVKNVTEKEVIHLQPLYLLNEQDVLTECTKLVVFDISGTRLVLPPDFTYLNPLTNLSASVHWTPGELHSLLPEDVGLKSLKSMLQYEMLNSVPVQTPYPCVAAIEQILHSSVFKTAIEKYACYCIRNPQPPQRVTEMLTEFQEKLQVEYLTDVVIKPQLIVNSEVISLQDTIHQEFFLQCNDDRYILSLKNTPNFYPTRVFRKMSKHLCTVLELQATNYFDPPDDEVPELPSFVCDLLNCGSVFNLADAIAELLPGCDDIEQDVVPTNPELGGAIPECWHHRLDQNPFNYFMPADWVGYEAEDGRIVYAQILHIGEILDSSEDNMLQQKYTITTGKDQPIKTTVLKLYKFNYDVKEPAEEFFSSDLLEIDEALSIQETMQFPPTDKQTIRDAVKAAWSLPEEEKRKAIKRLYLQYHPDKNPGNPHATANLQVLQEVIANLRMEREVAEEGWSGWFRHWDRTVFLHRRYRSGDQSRRSGSRGMYGGGGGGWNIPKPNKDHSEAKRWIKQAEYDYAALSGLENLSQTDEKMCAATCFMSHEVAEKALKAGMYVKCGMSDVTLKSHSLESLARALMQVGSLTDICDAVFLENFYSQPRFPYCYPSPIVPGEKYLSSTAREAFLAATRIYEVMKELIDIDE